MADKFDILLELFRTLTRASSHTQSACTEILKQQRDIDTYLKTLPVKDVKEMLKDHNDKSHNERKETSDDILESLKSLDSKVDNMITVTKTIGVVFTLAILIASIVMYFGTKNVEKTALNKRYNKTDIIKIIEEQQEKEHEALKKEVIEVIREELRKE